MSDSTSGSRQQMERANAMTAAQGRNRAFVAIAAIALLALAPMAVAQPGNPGPTTYVDLGDLGIGQTVQSADMSIAVGGVIWFRFRLTAPITPLANWLDLDTAGPSTIGNTEMAIYDARANKLGEDNDSGGGSTGWAAAMSFGGGSGQKLSGNDPTWGGGRISDGAWGQNLSPGVYYVAVVGYNADFSQDPNTNWQVSTNSTTTGTVRLRAATGVVPATYWNERHHGGEAGDGLGTVQVVEGSGPLTTIVTASNVSGRDMFKLRICDPESFQVKAVPTASGGGVYRDRLFIFDSSGRGVVAINNTVASTPTVLTLPAGAPAGDYYVAVNNYCANGAIEPNPFDAENQLIWTFVGSSTWNVALQPNGPGASNPLDFWGRLNSSCENADAYYIRLEFTGACHVLSEQPSCSGDLNGDHAVTADDAVSLAQCLSGPASSAICDPVIAVRADADHDGDVDLFDYAAFQRTLGSTCH